jgi:hypothetical protein
MKTTKLIAPCAAVLLSLSATAGSAQVPQNGIYYGCYNVGNTFVRLIDPSREQSCRAGEKGPIAWVDYATFKALEDRVAALESSLAPLAQHVTVNQDPVNGLPGPNVVFTGANVWIQSGSGATDDNAGGDPLLLSGLGNLIVGYNASRNPREPDLRSGSHNLIVGDQNDFTSWGGVVFGSRNSVKGEYAVVSGGGGNEARASRSSVTGGGGNVVAGRSASITGGAGNWVSGDNASVSGGQGNYATGTGSSVSGGRYNQASGTQASVCGGLFNYATANYSSVSGGNHNRAEANSSSVSGGFQITQATMNGWSAGSAGATTLPSTNVTSP